MLITSFFVGRCVGINYVPNTYVEHFNDTILHSDTIIDTLYLTETKPSYITKIKEDTVYIKDTTIITVPIEEYTFTDSTNYECKVDGFKVELKEMKLYPKTIKDEIEITNTIVKQNNKRWGIGVNVGIGTNGKIITPMIGLGVQYNIISF